MKLIATDIDSTIYYDHKLYLDDTFIGQVKNKNYLFCLASGRNLYDITKLNFNNADYIIACNGSIIYDNQNKKVIYNKKFDLELQEKIIELTKDYFINIEYLGYERKNISDNNVSKIELFFDNYNDLESSYNLLISNVNDITIYKTSSLCLEINIKGISKASAIKYLKDMLNIDTDICFGDGNNDVSMLKNAKVSVSVSNACIDAKNNSLFITNNVDEMGVFKFLNKYIMNE